MKIKVEYIDTGTNVKTLAHCRYHMADGTINHYYQLGKGGLNDEENK